MTGKALPCKNKEKGVYSKIRQTEFKVKSINSTRSSHQEFYGPTNNTA